MLIKHLKLIMNLVGLLPLVTNTTLAPFLYSIYSILAEPLQCLRVYRRTLRTDRNKDEANASSNNRYNEK
jgi:hypothetical protein